MPSPSVACDVAIEYGHSQLLPSGGYDAYSELRMSAVYASDARARVEGMGFTTTVQMLVDDKRLGKDEEVSRSLPELRKDAKSLLPVNCLVLESRLVRLWQDFVYRSIAPSKQRRVAERLEGYLDQHGSLGCSHDIALWHALRLGLVDPLLLDGKSDRVASVQGQLQTCKIAVSILPARWREFEEIADADILVWNRVIDVERQVLRFYYTDVPGPVDVSSRDWLDFCSRLEQSLKDKTSIRDTR